MSELILLDSAGAGVSGEQKVVGANAGLLLVSADNWGDGKVTVEYLRRTDSGESWQPLADGEFTANDEKELATYPGMIVRAVTSGSTGPTAATVIFGNQGPLK